MARRSDFVNIGDSSALLYVFFLPSHDCSLSGAWMNLSVFVILNVILLVRCAKEAHRCKGFL